MQTYSDNQVQERLSRDLPSWKLDHGTICRTYRTHGWRVTLMVVNTIGHLAEVSGHHPDLAVSYAAVQVRLSTHDAHGITDKDFALAAKLDEVVLWHVDPPPGDYVKYGG
jgi:4a-hydroxytetrahydrobiopterin dehydratase